MRSEVILSCARQVALSEIEVLAVGIYSAGESSAILPLLIGYGRAALIRIITYLTHKSVVGFVNGGTKTVAAGVASPTMTHEPPSCW